MLVMTALLLTLATPRRELVKPLRRGVLVDGGVALLSTSLNMSLDPELKEVCCDVCLKAGQKGCKCGECDDSPVCWCSNAYTSCPKEYESCSAGGGGGNKPYQPPSDDNGDGGDGGDGSAASASTAAAASLTGVVQTAASALLTQ